MASGAVYYNTPAAYLSRAALNIDAAFQLLHCCFTAALLLIYPSIAVLNITKSEIFAQPPALLLFYCCFTAALLLLYRCFTAALLYIACSHMWGP